MSRIMRGGSTVSRPSRARELKPRQQRSLHIVQLSRPSRARELKHYAEKYVVAKLLSRPSRARELKQTQIETMERVRKVAPLAGA